MLQAGRRARSGLILCVALLSVLALGVRALLDYSPASAQARRVSLAALTDFQKRSLLIMDQNVIADPDRTNDPCQTAAPLKVWSFGALMKGIAGTSDDAATVTFIRHWLDQFSATNLRVNGQPVAPRNIDGVLIAWENNGWDPRLVPFRLLAIVNRIDLLRSPLLAGENAGEVRFVFGAITTAKDGTCGGANFTVILEFGVRKSSCDELQDWAQRWVDLGDPRNPPPSDSQYRANLQKLTDAVTLPNSKPAKPNGSAIDHVRTNENLAGVPEWELREFALEVGTKQLTEDTVTLTPRDGLNGSPALAAFLKSIDLGIEATPPDYWIPRTFPTAPNGPLLGATAFAGTAWQSHPLNFAINTCSGCHGGRTDAITHIDPLNGTISSFLMDDLSRRESGLRSLAQYGCLASLSDNGRMVH